MIQPRPERKGAEQPYSAPAVATGTTDTARHRYGTKTYTDTQTEAVVGTEAA